MATLKMPKSYIFVYKVYKSKSLKYKFIYNYKKFYLFNNFSLYIIPTNQFMFLFHSFDDFTISL